jgi:nucleoside-diphosphate-sugar epimerase
MATLLLAGFGTIAQQLATQLLDDNQRVIGVSRSRKSFEHSNFTAIRCDLTQPIAKNAFKEPVDIVVITLTPDAYTDDDYRKIYFQATQNILDYFDGSSTQVIFVSSTRVYGQTQGEWVDENTPTIPADEKGRILVEAEQLVLNHNTNNCVVRFAGIYGQGRNRFLKKIEQGAELQKSPPYYTNRIHQDDCVGILKLIIDKKLSGENTESIYIGCDDDKAPIFEVAEWLAKSFGFPMPTAKPENSLIQNKRCNNKKIKELGYKFIFPSFKDGYRK